MPNWTVTNSTGLPGVTVMRDGVIVWHDSEAGSYTAEAWRTLLRDLGDIKMRMYAAEDATRAASANNVEIPDEEAENIRTVQDAINYIQEHLE